MSSLTGSSDHLERARPDLDRRLRFASRKRRGRRHIAVRQVRRLCRRERRSHRSRLGH